MNQSIHTIDLLLYLMGPMIMCARKLYDVDIPIEVEDTAVALCEFQSGDGRYSGINSNWSKTGHPAEIHITGSQGSVFMDDCFQVWEFVDRSEEDQVIETSSCFRRA